MTEYADVPPEVLARIRAICTALPDVHEQPAWVGTRWMVRKRTFWHVFAIDGEAGPITLNNFRSAGEELDVLRRSGHPFFQPGWGTNTVGMVFDAATDWDEVAELATESYCTVAPKKLAARVIRPDGER